MSRKATIWLAAMLLAASAAPEARCEILRGGATLSAVSSVVKISREGNSLDSLVEGEVLYIFTESGEPVSQIVIRDVFSDEIYSEPLPDAVARQIRETGSILVFSNLREYGDYIKSYLEGTADAFRAFIDRHPESELREEARRIVDGLVYRPYKIKGTLEAFNEFIREHPENYYLPNAVERRDRLLFLPVREADRISGYRRFIYTYPDNMFSREAKERIRTLKSAYEESRLQDLARYPRSHMGKKVRFSCELHSALPIYVEGPGVGRKTDLFKSPRNSLEYLNFQVREKEIVLWRLFVSREDEDTVKTVEGAQKGSQLMVYGVVFDILGGAPWIDVHDVETY